MIFDRADNLDAAVGRRGAFQERDQHAADVGVAARRRRSEHVRQKAGDRHRIAGRQARELHAESLRIQKPRRQTGHDAGPFALAGQQQCFAGPHRLAGRKLQRGDEMMSVAGAGRWSGQEMLRKRPRCASGF